MEAYTKQYEEFRARQQLAEALEVKATLERLRGIACTAQTVASWKAPSTEEYQTIAAMQQKIEHELSAAQVDRIHTHVLSLSLSLSLSILIFVYYCHNTNR
jgi:hypothetical protein